jgi:hypothetical protein
VRDPWFPVALMLIPLLTIWLGIVGPMPNGFVAGLQQWQTLTAAMVALFAAGIAFHNTTRSLRHAENLESRRRDRKHPAVRAVLPLALAQVTEYAERTLRALDELVNKCEGQALPRLSVPENFIQPLPSDTLKTLADFIEYSDAVDVTIVEELVERFQSSNHMGCSKRSHPVDGKPKMQLSGFMESIV